LKIISSTEFSILPKLWGLSTAPQKFYRRFERSGFNQTLSPRQRNIYIGLSRRCQITATIGNSAAMGYYSVAAELEADSVAYRQ
jgi:hypothetical protein